MTAMEQQAPTGDLTAELNEAQKQSVVSENPHLLILAGAGTGKTRTLIHRIAWKLEQDRGGSRRVMAVTFTKKAANELEMRLVQLLSDEGARQRVMAGTFHSMAHRQLRKFGSRIGLPGNFSIIDTDDQKRLGRQLMLQENIKEQHYPVGDFFTWFNRYKEIGVRVRDIQEDSNPTWIRLAKVYEEHCRKEGLVDFGELLLASCELMETCADVRDYYHETVSSLFVDEFQDTNAIQYRWFKLLVGKDTGTTLVGDDDQAIYGWRGARVQNMEDYLREFNADIIRMTQNYRSTGTILKAANAIISKNKERLGKDLFTEAELGERVRIYAACNDIDEARYTAQIIEDWHARGNSLSDIAVLYRSNALSRVFEEEMVRSRIPYRIYGGVRFYGRAEIKDALAWLQLVHDPHHDIAFQRAIRSPRRGVGEATLDKMRQLAPAGSLWEGACAFAQSGASSAGKVAGFIAIVEHLRKYAGQHSLDKLVAELNSASGLEEMYTKKSEGGISLQENLQELVRASSSFEQHYERVTPEDEKGSVVERFLAQALLDGGDEQAGGYADAINMMTIHASKGLEFPVIVLVGMEEELLPHVKALQGGMLEEERRLCYVGMTRGITRLYMSWSAARKTYGKVESRRRSRFLDELPAELVLEVEGGLPPSDNPIFVQDIANGNRVADKANGETRSKSDKAVRTGDAVIHPVFGEGVIVASEGGGEDMRLRINFPEHGTKLLLASRAGLTSAR